MDELEKIWLRCNRRKFTWNKEIIVDRIEREIKLDDKLKAEIAEKLVNADIRGFDSVDLSRNLNLDTSSTVHSIPYGLVDEMWIDFGNGWKMFLIQNKARTYTEICKKTKIEENA